MTSTRFSSSDRVLLWSDRPVNLTIPVHRHAKHCDPWGIKLYWLIRIRLRLWPIRGWPTQPTSSRLTWKPWPKLLPKSSPMHSCPTWADNPAWICLLNFTDPACWKNMAYRLSVLMWMPSNGVKTVWRLKPQWKNLVSKCRAARRSTPLKMPRWWQKIWVFRLLFVRLIPWGVPEAAWSIILRS